MIINLKFMSGEELHSADFTATWRLYIKIFNFSKVHV